MDGGAGTGKTILAVYIIKLLMDIKNDEKKFEYVENDEFSYSLMKLIDDLSKNKLAQISNIGFVVPMRALREAMKKIFKSIDGLSEDMVLAPEEVVYRPYYDLLVVDEAHRLYRRKNLPGAHLYPKFDQANRKFLGKEEIKKDVSDPTELDWIIGNSRLQILFYDRLQTIRVTDIDIQRFNDICMPHRIATYTLQSQMRCSGGNGYYEYVKMVLGGERLSLERFRHFDDYQTQVYDDINQMFIDIEKRNNEYALCKVLCGPGWSKSENIDIQSHEFKWASGEKDKNSNIVWSIHQSQGFDLNFAGVIFGKEIFYDNDKGIISVNKKELKDQLLKPEGNTHMRQYILNIYLTLMTRGIRGTYIFAVDESLREYLRKFFG